MLRQGCQVGVPHLNHYRAARTRGHHTVVVELWVGIKQLSAFKVSGLSSHHLAGQGCRRYQIKKKGKKKPLLLIAPFKSDVTLVFCVPATASDSAGSLGNNKCHSCRSCQVYTRLNENSRGRRSGGLLTWQRGNAVLSFKLLADSHWSSSLRPRTKCLIQHSGPEPRGC